MLVLLIRRSLEKFFKKNFRDDRFCFGFAKVLALAFLLSLNLSTAFAETTCNSDGTKLIISGSGTFNGCPNDPPKTATEVIIGTGFTSIGDGAFWGASNLTSITIPKGVTSIGTGAFWGTSSLTSITIPDSVTSIGNQAFQNATGLTSITIPNSVESIGAWAFYGATGLKSITIPEGVTSIGGEAFRGASSLESITIPDSVKSIGSWFFYGAKSLESIIIPDNIDTKNWDAVAFGYFPQKTKIVCQGDLNTCYENLAKYIPTDKGGDCTSYCISPDRIIKATDPSQCSGNYGWSGAGCSRKNDDGSVPCVSGFIEWNKQCWSEYPFAKKRWTPAEANEWLHDGNDNFVVITFKK